MTKGNPKWEQFEHSVQNLLNLRSTPGSGNQWHDVSDGVSRPDDPYKVMIDCKYTEGKTYSLNGTMLQKWRDATTELGYNFALPVRLDGVGGRRRDWVVIPLDDYAELVDSFRTLNRPKRCGSRFGPDPILPCCRRTGHFGHHDNGETEWSA